VEHSPQVVHLCGILPIDQDGPVNKQNRQSFIKVIKERYQNDDLVEIKPNYLKFKAGEGHKFLRFSSGSCAKGVKEYTDTVTRVAQVSLGSRIRCWNEAADERGFYNWQEVHTSIESYEQVCYWLLKLFISMSSDRFDVN